MNRNMTLAIAAFQRGADLHSRLVDVLLRTELLDEDGYPTENALTIIEIWPYTDFTGWMKFIESLWAYHDFGWTEGEAPHDWDEHRTVYRYDISTAGWSGNEGIIRSMEKNSLWDFYWVSSRRGGHYVFERDCDETVDKA